MSAPTDSLALVGTKYVVLKDPDAVLDYSFDWSAYLLAGGADTIASATVTCETGKGLVVNSTDPTFPAGVVTGWCSGGTVGQTVGITCQIVTALGRTDDRTLYVVIKQR
jgi:hypothetical protein